MRHHAYVIIRPLDDGQVEYWNPRFEGSWTKDTFQAAVCEDRETMFSWCTACHLVGYSRAKVLHLNEIDPKHKHPAWAELVELDRDPRKERKTTLPGRPSGGGR